MGTFNDISDIFTDMANSLRSKMGISNTFTPAQIAPAINNIETLEIPQRLPPSSSEGVIGYVGSFAPIPNKAVHSEYGDIVINYNYNRFDGSISQIFEVTDASNLFANNTNNVMNFDLIKFGNNVTNMAYTFYGCEDFRQPITIPNSVTDMAYTFSRCYYFDQPITIPNSVTNMDFTFSSCYYFRRPITIPNSVTTMSGTLCGCWMFNQPITIPDNVTNMASTFDGCSNFNQPITIPNSVTDMAYTFSGCENFNQPITIPDNVTNMASTFYYCTNFNQPITIPDNVTDVNNAFRNCSNFGSTIYFKNSSKLTNTNTRNMFYGCNKSLHKDIFCDNATPFISITNVRSIVGATVTWSTMTNGYYNATYKVYIYNNYTP